MINPIIASPIHCALNQRHYRLVLRDLAELLNYNSPLISQPIARIVGQDTLRLEAGWRALPDWLSAAEIQRVGESVRLSLTVAESTPPEAVEGLAALLVEELTELFGHPVHSVANRVFCLGWEKTGTTSLTAAMRRLGYLCWHSSPWMIGIPHKASEIPETLTPDLARAEDYDFLSDLPIPALYRELDQAYPGSRFILTTRPVDDWLPSALAEIEKGLDASGELPSMVRWAYATKTLMPEVLRQRYSRHYADVVEYFAGRDDLLVINLAEADPWPRLCGFLGLPVPEVDFPWLNKRTVL